MADGAPEVRAIRTQYKGIGDTIVQSTGRSASGVMRARRMTSNSHNKEPT
jgi:hypothetical protein